MIVSRLWTAPSADFPIDRELLYLIIYRSPHNWPIGWELRILWFANFLWLGAWKLPLPYFRFQPMWWSTKMNYHWWTDMVWTKNMETRSDVTCANVGSMKWKRPFAAATTENFYAENAQGKPYLSVMKWLYTELQHMRRRWKMMRGGWKMFQRRPSPLPPSALPPPPLHTIANLFRVLILTLSRWHRNRFLQLCKAQCVNPKKWGQGRQYNAASTCPIQNLSSVAWLKWV